MNQRALGHGLEDPEARPTPEDDKDRRIAELERRIAELQRTAAPGSTADGDPWRSFEVLAEHSRDAVLCVRWDDGRILEANAAAVRSYGYDRDELLGLNIRDLRAPETVALTRQQLDQANTTGLLFETVHRRRDGSTFPVEVSSRGATLAQTHILVSVIRDITERKRAEDALRESEHRVRLKLEAILSPDRDLGALELADVIDPIAIQSLVESFFQLTGLGVGIIDLKGRVLVGVGWRDICTRFHRAHPETCRYCVESDLELSAGVPEGQYRLYKCKNNMWDAATPIVVGGRHLGNIFTGQFFFEDEPIDVELFRAQARRYGFPEEAYLAALGRVQRVPRQAVHEGMRFYAQLAHMLSQLGYSNLELARSVSDRDRLMNSLRDADRRKNDFLAVLSHELRNPLSPIRNSVYVLEHAVAGSDQASRAREVIDRQAVHMTRLIDDLLDVTRITRGKVRLQRERLELNALLRRTVDDHRELFRRAGVALEVELCEEPLTVDADATRIAQVAGNLLQNAAKFTPRGGHARLSLAAEPGGQARFEVCDDGAGITPEVLTRLFEPFVQADTTLDRSRGGLGLGLALIKGLVELHGGSVSAHSDGPGKGARFVVRLPIDLTAQPGRASRAVPDAALGPRRVLIIEDNADAADSLREALELEEHVVEVASDGAQGVEKARAFSPDVVLCDIGLPLMDGYAVARALRADAALTHAYLVAVTGYALQEDIEACRQAGFDRHLAKPPDLEVLSRLVAEVPRRAIG